MMTTAETLSGANDKSPDTTFEQSANCLACGSLIEGFAANSPGRHTVEPCGCELGFVRASDIAQEMF
ncbi:hypothetical protein C440_08117 [Haloferax mucosum ATCC BAA-1512]|uniref:Uncharacterized protein n=1 Tax=Haloferax mucosum ATCC BAA-1512 TaxID=662479 RepID=M0IE59_9EURY|nr:hypothetical protein C440_08117 [Haloferax mucosum ATCC BAA-1512]